MKALVLLGLLLSFAFLASAKDRYPIRSSLRAAAVDLNGKVVEFPGGAGFTFQINGAEGETANITVFDGAGKQVRGRYQVPADVIREALKVSITEGLKATEKGATVPKEPCCDVPVKEPEDKDNSDIPIPTPRPDIEGDQRPKKQEPRDEPSEADRAAPSVKGGNCAAFNAYVKAPGVPRTAIEAIRKAMYFMEKNQKSGKLGRMRYIGVADYAQKSSQKRFYLLDLENKTVRAEKVSHGGGTKKNGYKGDPNHDGLIDKCSRPGDRGLTRPGFFKVGDYALSTKNRYKWPLLKSKPPLNKMIMTGMSGWVNSDAEGDGVVMHEAKYNSAAQGSNMGRSHGCPAFAPGHGEPVMDALRGGSLLFLSAPMCKDHMEHVDAQVSGWQGYCK